MSAVHQVTHIDFVSKRKIWYALSLAMLIPGIIFFMMGGLKLGLDFTGGALFELAFEKPPTVSAVRETLQTSLPEKFSDAQVAALQDDSGQAIISVKSKPIDNLEQVKVFDALKKNHGTFQQVRVEVVGPSVGGELTQKAILSTIVVMGMIVLYISIRFSFDYAATGIIALAHDVMIVVGIFAMLGHFFGIEVDSLFVTAILTVAGFSIHDTIVTFDRVRENAGDMGRGKIFAEVANDSINQTLARSINTSLTVMFPLFTLTFFGGVTIKYFAMAMLIGIICGVYSSIFVASPLLVDWRAITKPSTRGRRAEA